MTEFNEKIDRRKSGDIKWCPEVVSQNIKARVDDNMLPLWVADMDFKSAPPIMAALEERLAHGIFGYCHPTTPCLKAVTWWQGRRFGWRVDPEWVQMTPTVVSAINIAIRAFTEPGDGVIVQQPVYRPFSDIVTGSGRRAVNNALVSDGAGYYTMDLEALRQQTADPRTKMLILCSPHNPVGRVWHPEELRALADICLENNVLVVTDEIHSDLIYPGHTHYNLMALSPKYEDAFIYLSGPGKTFNIPGLTVAYAIIPNGDKRRAFIAEQRALTLEIENTFGLAALTAAYSEAGETWMLKLLHYLEGNVTVLGEFVEKKLPGVTMKRPEGTYLCWLDFRGTGFNDRAIREKIMGEAGVIGNAGPWFGQGGEGFLRLNVGCTRQTLEEALWRIKSVLE